MRLIKLEITGFKSFQDKTAIIFPPGITAVVGPNGCGKSNIVDALRWVMGEQSVRQLRGKSMEDLIFSGADGKQPLNMAEVSLLIDNSSDQTDGSTLSAYTEIMVTRRLYRSGESSYLINRQPCRLKDIHNLFLGSGSGKNSFAVIQQGNIGALTDATPEERRFFIEDAADITKFKDKKKDTLSRIKTTRENLTRLSDIVAELKRQMNSLERQAAKAKKFKEYRSRIKTLDIRIAIWHFDALSRDIFEKAARVEDKKEQEQITLVTLNSLETLISNIGLTAADMKSNISELSRNQFDLQRTIDKIENDLDHLNKDEQRIVSELNDIRFKADDAEKKNKNLEHEINETRASHVDTDEDLTRLEQDIQTEQNRINTLKAEQNAIETERRKLTQNHMTLAGSEAKANSILQHAEQRKNEISRRIKLQSEELLESERKVREALNVKNESSRQREEAYTEISALVREKVAVTEKITSEKKSREELRNRIKINEIDLSGLESKYTTLKKIQDGFGWYKDGVKDVMSHFKGIESSPVKGLVADRLSARPGYEKIAEAGLGDILQYIIVESDNDIHEPIRFLKEYDKGKCGFVIIKRTEQHCQTRINAPGLTPLHECLTFDNEDQSMIRSLTENTLVADNLEQALEFIWEKEKNVRIVTREGEVLTASGTVTGGGKETVSSIFTKKKELEDLQEAINGKKEKQTRLTTEWDAVERELQTLTTSEINLTESLKDAETEKTRIEKKHFMAEEQVRHLEQRREILMLENDQLEGEEEDIEQEIEKNRALAETIHQQILDSESILKKGAEKLAGIVESIETQNAGILELKLKLTRLKTKSDHYHTTLKRLEDFLSDGNARLKRLKGEIDDRNNRLIMISDTRTRFKTDQAGFLANLDTVADSLTKARSALSDIEKHLKLKEKEKAETQKQKEALNDTIRATEFELSQLRMKRENITSRIEEKYHHQINQYKLEFEETEFDNLDLTAMDIAAMEAEVEDLNTRVSQLGDVNLSAITEFEELKTRYDFLEKQQADLVKSLEDLETIINKINDVSQERFMETFHAINEKLATLFPTLFEGGTARMILTDPSQPLETGVELMIQPPGKKLTRLSLLSGGEKALSAIAFVFSIFLIRPSSFCIMDEIDAPLDDANVTRFNNLVKHIGEQSQILMITHNKLTMEYADILFGVTMEKRGVSKIVSVSLTGNEDMDGFQQ